MCSNNEDTPVLIEPGETRYWVRKINPLKNDDTSFLQKLITEIPAFLYFLQHRQLTTEKESRNVVQSATDTYASSRQDYQL